MRGIDIINLAKKMRNEINGSNDPGLYCQKNGIVIRKTELNPNVYPAFTTNINGVPIITLNARYSLKSQFVMCAHELGHAVLHKDNYYNGFGDNNPTMEYEANLFAVAFLFDEEHLDVKLEHMSNSELESLLKFNISLLPNGQSDYRYY